MLIDVPPIDIGRVTLNRLAQPVPIAEAGRDDRARSPFTVDPIERVKAPGGDADTGQRLLPELTLDHQFDTLAGAVIGDHFFGDARREVGERLIDRVRPACPCETRTPLA